jgi:hypothetical protein
MIYFCLLIITFHHWNLDCLSPKEGAIIEHVQRGGSDRLMEFFTTSWSKSLTFALNGRKVVLSNVSCELTLLEYLRSVGLTGSKLGCGEVSNNHMS